MQHIAFLMFCKRRTEQARAAGALRGPADQGCAALSRVLGIRGGEREPAGDHGSASVGVCNAPAMTDESLRGGARYSFLLSGLDASCAAGPSVLVASSLSHWSFSAPERLSQRFDSPCVKVFDFRFWSAEAPAELCSLSADADGRDALAGEEGALAESADRSEVDWAKDGAERPQAAQANAAIRTVAFIARS